MILSDSKLLNIYQPRNPSDLDALSCSSCTDGLAERSTLVRADRFLRHARLSLDPGQRYLDPTESMRSAFDTSHSARILSMIATGDTITCEHVITAEMVADFAAVTGDHNPVHLDEEFARRSRFGRRIAHGMLCGSLISRAIAMEMPGPGTIYLQQELNFKAPVYIGDVVQVVIRCSEVRSDKPIARLLTTVRTAEGAAAIDGHALVLLP